MGAFVSFQGVVVQLELNVAVGCVIVIAAASGCVMLRTWPFEQLNLTVLENPRVAALIADALLVSIASAMERASL